MNEEILEEFLNKWLNPTNVFKNPTNSRNALIEKTKMFKEDLEKVFEKEVEVKEDGNN